MSDLIFYGAAILVAGYVFWVWLEDLRAADLETSENILPVKKGRVREEAGAKTPLPQPSPEGGGGKPSQPVFPGATPVSMLAVIVAVGGAIILLEAEIIGEGYLGIVGEQTKMTVIFGLYTLAAAFIEELIFRGYLYYDRGTRGQLVASIVVMSLLFALIHPYLWQWKMPDGASSWQVWRGTLTVSPGVKPVFSTCFVFVRSLWFYCCRFCPLNPRRSLIPCFAAHLTTNLGVWIIKGLQGATAGWY